MLLALVLFVGISGLIIGLRRKDGASNKDLAETINLLSKQVREIQQDHINISVEFAEFRAGVGRLLQQIINLGEIPVWNPYDSNRAKAETDKERELYHDIGERFNDDELRDLAYRMRIEYEDLPANTRRGKAQALVSYTARRGRLKELTDLVDELRPQDK